VVGEPPWVDKATSFGKQIGQIVLTTTGTVPAPLQQGQELPRTFSGGLATGALYSIDGINDASSMALLAVGSRVDMRGQNATRFRV
jgi:hypothetical protein